MANVLSETVGAILTALGWDGTGFRAFTLDGDGHLQVDVLSIVPGLHHDTHEDGGADEIDVTGLVGAGGFYDAYVRLHEEQPQNNDAGAFNTGAWRVRNINTEDDDVEGICALAGNQITLAAGWYRCLITCPAYRVDAHTTRLWNSTSPATVLQGTAGRSANGDASVGVSVLAGRFQIALNQALEVQHRCETSVAASGFGKASLYGVGIFTVAEFWREA